MSQYLMPSQILAIEYGEISYSEFSHKKSNFP